MNSKALSAAATVLLLFAVLSLTPAIAFDATSIVHLSATSGGVGTVITVWGSPAGSPIGANPFGQVKVFWDNLGTLLNGTAFAAADGSFSTEITIPAAVAGNHYVIVQDSLGTQASAIFTVVPSLDIDTGPFVGQRSFNASYGSNVYVVNTISINSTVSDFSFDQALKRIRFSVSGTSGTAGVCYVTIPEGLMSGNFSLFMDDSQLARDVDYIQAFNGTHYLFSIDYRQSVHIIEIVATNVIPEFQSASLLFLFAMLASALTSVFRGKLKKNL